MRYWLLLLALYQLASGVAWSSEQKKVVKRNAAENSAIPELVAVAANEQDDDEDSNEDDPKRLVCYLNFELKPDPKVKKGIVHVISDKSGYDNNGDISEGGEILKYTDKDFTCNEAARLWSSDIRFKGDLFQAKPKKAITIAAWIKIEEKPGQHSIFDTIGVSHSQGQFHFEVNDGVLRWFHRNECKKTVFETMGHTVSKDKWSHVAGTYDSKTKQAKVFINGELRNQSIGDGCLSSDWATEACIGSHLHHRPLRGSIDEFRIYNYALKPDEIRALVGACRGGTDAGAESRSETLEPVDGSSDAKQSPEASVKKLTLPRSVSKDVKAAKRQCVPSACSADCICPGGGGEDTPEDEDDDEPKRLVVYYNFEKVNHNKRISDKSGYENSGMMTPGGEILKYSDKDYTCNQAGRLWESFISLRADTFQAKPKTAITIAAWLKLEEKSGLHSIFDTCGSECPHTHGVFLFQVNDGVVRWFHKDEKQNVVFESMAHAVPKGHWTHIAGTYDYKTKQAKIFINGEIRNQSIGEGQLSRDWGAKAEIGQSGIRALRGSVDEFRIYNYALKPDEIKALVSACKAGPPDENEVADGSNAEAPAPAVETSGTARSNLDRPSDNSSSSSISADSKGGGDENKSVL